MILPQDYYQTLSLKRDCEDDEIRYAYRKLALKHHPERNPELGAKERFKIKRKAIYDQYGIKGLKEGVQSREGIDLLNKDFSGYPGGYEFHGDGDLVFSEFFGTKNPFADFFVGKVESPSNNAFGKKFGGLHGLSNTSAFEPEHEKPVEFDLNLSLEEVYSGCIKKMKITRKLLNNDGMTTSLVDKILTIQVNPGWKAGTKIVFAKEGDQGPNKIPADIVFNVKYEPHDRFKREGDNLIMNAEVPLVKALVGYSLDIETLDGRILRVPVNDTITPEYKKVVKYEGMPNPKTGERGDLIITFKTSYPHTLTTEQKDMLRKAFH